MNKTATHKEEINISDEMVMNQIYVIRGQKVMLDTYLAEFYINKLVFEFKLRGSK